MQSSSLKSRGRVLALGDQDLQVFHGSQRMKIPPVFDFRHHRIGPNQTASLGSNVEFEINPNAFLGDMWLSFTLAAPTTNNLTEGAGLIAIDRVNLRIGSDIVLEYRDYPETVIGKFVDLEEHKKAACHEAWYPSAGGGDVYSSGPLLLPWSKFWHADEAVVNPAMFLSNEKWYLEVYFGTSADLLSIDATGSTSISNVFLNYLTYDIEGAQKSQFKSEVARQLSNGGLYRYIYTDYTPIVTNTSITTGTDTTVSLTPSRGLLSSIYFYLRSVANVDTNNLQFAIEDINYFDITVDGSELVRRYNDYIDTLNQSMISGGHIRSFGVGKYPVHIHRFELFHSEGREGVFAGGFHSDHASSNFDLLINHAVGANAYLTVIQESKFSIVFDGHVFRRQEL